MQLPQGRVTDKLHPLRLPWTGRLITAVDQTLIGTNFQSLINLRSTGVNLRAVSGMTKITATGISGKTDTKALFHFMKSRPAESHVLAIARSYWGGVTSEYTLYDNLGTIPATAEFSGTTVDYVKDDNAIFANMSNAPSGTMAYCDNINTKLWGGTRSNIQGFIVQDASGNLWDYTDAVSDGDATFTQDVAYMKGKIAYIQTTRAIDLIEWTVGTANATNTGALTISYWNNDTTLLTGTAQNTGETITYGSHGFSDGNQVFFSTVVTGITANTRYYVISATTDTFQISLTQGGSAVLIGADGNVTFYCIGWKSVGAVTDNTALSTASLGRSSTTRTMTFTSTVDLAGVTMINKRMGIWHKVEWGTAPDVTTTVSLVTVRTPMQEITDIWDGQTRPALQAWLYNSGSSPAKYDDITINLAKQDAVYTIQGTTETYTPETVAILNGMVANDILYFGFEEPQMGLGWVMAPEGRSRQFSNTAAATMTIRWWDGDSWVVSAVQDFTSSPATKSLGVSGESIYSPAPFGAEMKRTVNNSRELYYYQVQFSGTLSSPVMVDQVYGIPAPKEIPAYSFPFMAQDRLFLLDEINGDRNGFWASAPGSSAIWNGDLSIKDVVGDDTKFTCGCELYTRYQSNLYSIILLFKQASMWALVGTEKWTKYQIPSSDGCPAPLTLKTVNLPIGTLPEMSRSVAIWQGTHGIYISDGGPPQCISDDISNYFDKNKTECINDTYIDDSFAFIDEDNMEYHWCFMSGSSATRKEMVCQLGNKLSWYEIQRGSLALTAGATVHATNGRSYTYGIVEGASASYLERLEYGNTFDGGNIVCTAWFGDMLLAEQPFYKCSLKHLNLMTVAKAVTTNNIVYTHYVDGVSDVTYNLDPTRTGFRVADIWQPVKSKFGRYHSLKFVMTTADESICFEPLDLALYYHIEEVIAK